MGNNVLSLYLWMTNAKCRKHFEGQNLRGTGIFFTWLTMINDWVASTAANSAAYNLLVQFASAGWSTVPDRRCLLNHWSFWEELVSICTVMNPGALHPCCERYLQQSQEALRLRAISCGWSAGGEVRKSRQTKLASRDKHGVVKQTDSQSADWHSQTSRKIISLCFD